jgi:hypothetical protein
MLLNRSNGENGKFIYVDSIELSTAGIVILPSNSVCPMVRTGN